ncbi:hypothetical protein BJ742DRAFT_778542 [Cladochytrium replicatum]|nr:hypothetical protein BJ742DRAFT_778542 [Cladochytrium replicatum]
MSTVHLLAPNNLKNASFYHHDGQGHAWQDLLMSLQRDINILGESPLDRLAKPRALERIRSATVGGRGGSAPDSAAAVDSKVLKEIFGVLLKPLCRWGGGSEKGGNLSGKSKNSGIEMVI